MITDSKSESLEFFKVRLGRKASVMSGDGQLETIMLVDHG